MSLQHNGHVPARQLRRQRTSARRPFYTNLTIEQRAAVAARWIDQGWPATKAAGLACVNPSYVHLAHQLSPGERSKLANGEVKLAQLHKAHVQHLAERRARRQAAEQEAEVQRQQAEIEAAIREDQQRGIDSLLDNVGADRIVDHCVDRFGSGLLLDVLDVVLRRRGRDIVEVVVERCGPERATRLLDRLTAPPQAVAEE